MKEKMSKLNYILILALIILIIASVIGQVAYADNIQGWLQIQGEVPEDFQKIVVVRMMDLDGNSFDYKILPQNQYRSNNTIEIGNYIATEIYVASDEGAYDVTWNPQIEILEQDLATLLSFKVIDNTYYKEEIELPPETNYGYLAIKVAVPEDFNQNILVDLKGEHGEMHYIEIAPSSNYKSSTRLPVGSYEILQMFGESDEFNLFPIKWQKDVVIEAETETLVEARASEAEFTYDEHSQDNSLEDPEDIESEVNQEEITEVETLKQEVKTENENKRVTVIAIIFAFVLVISIISYIIYRNYI